MPKTPSKTAARNPVLTDLPPHDLVLSAVDRMILSVSGWRAVFADEEQSDSPSVSAAFHAVVALATDCYIKTRDATTILVARDARPTGESLADTVLRVCAANEVKTRYLDIAAIPQVTSWVTSDPEIGGFVYVSASHNPIGHNGLKFGSTSGGVIDREEAQHLIDAFRRRVVATDAVEVAVDLIRRGATGGSRLRRAAEIDQPESLSRYEAFTTRVVTSTDDPVAAEERLHALAAAVRERPVGVVVDFNGSARAASIDVAYLSRIGAQIKALNATPGAVAHQILPEGPGLDAVRDALATEAAADPSFMIGYTPDNDGDRGNLVVVDRASNGGAPQVRALDAQEVFALACVAELSYMEYSKTITYSAEGRAHQKIAIVANGPTSLRIDRIAAAFDARVFRAEVGEANVISLADHLRHRGFLVRILGEGSNGGTIIHPARVRDPLNTVLSLVRLLATPPTEDTPGPLGIWCRRASIEYHDGFDLADLLSTLPRFTTSATGEPEAKLSVRTTNHATLKERYESVFRRTLPRIQEILRPAFGDVMAAEFNYEGRSETRGAGYNKRTGKQTGGLRVVFKDSTGERRAAIWMRGSGTEPVFRILADVEGDRPDVERQLLAIQAEMVTEADAAS